MPDPGKGMEQAGLAAAIGPDQADQFTPGEAEGGAVQTPGQGQIGRAQDHGRSRQRICATSQRKKGAPIRAVTTPIGKVRPIGAMRVTKSAAISSNAPIKAAGRIARPGWPLVSRRAKIRAINPMKPIAPPIATTA